MSSDSCMAKVEQDDFKDRFVSFLRKCGKRIVVKKMDISPGCPNGENFVGEVIRVRISGFLYTSEDEKEDFSESYIVKRIPGPQSVNHKFFNCRNMFDNEIAGYEVVVRTFDDFVKDKQLKKNWKRTCFAEYYGSAYDFIALQDLKTKGYQMGNRVQGFNVQECLLVLEKLSFFHALSFSMKSAEKVRFGEIVGRLRETVFCEEMAEGVVGVYWDNAVKLAVKSLRNREELKLRRPITILTSYLDSVFLGLMEVIKPEDPFDVICHGDLWTNNVLLRFIDGEAIDIKMIDLQSMRHGSCVLDVMHFLFTSLQTGLLETNFNEIITFYYNYLAMHMKSFGVEPEFSLQDLKNEFKKRVRYGICVACLVFTFVTKTEPEQNDVVLTKEELSAEEEIERTHRGLTELYHERLYNLVTALMAFDLM